MIKKVFKGLEVNEKDNLFTALSKGIVEGVVTGAVGSLTIAGTLYLIGNVQKGKVEIQKLGE